LSLILHLADSVAGSVKVGMAGPSITLPCCYNGAVTSMCWNTGVCSLFTCRNSIVWTNGTHVTYRKDTRYKLLGDLSRRDFSLTIENIAVSDSGLYCCRVEQSGWFNDMKITISLEIVPPRVMTTSIVTNVPTVTTVQTSTIVPMTTSIPMTITVLMTTVPMTMSAPTSVPTTTNHESVATSPSSPQPAETHLMTLQGEIRTQPTSSPLHSFTTDGNDTVTDPQMATTTKGIYAGVCISVLVLLALLGVIIAKKYFFKKKIQQLSVSFSSLQIKALQNAVKKEVQAEDNIYTENSLYATD
uniref:Ig-like domain-containing protein n=1 Tax=Nomascus leucogenys TaxID=61853 RepID=A0A2I3GXH0_NOMLE